MGLRFRKSVKLLKGAKVNFSKSGVSLSVGGKGHSLNFSSRGVKRTIGLPGTGLSYSKLSSGHHSNSSVQKRNSSINGQSKSEITIRMNQDGKIVILDSNDTPITDEALLRKIKTNPAYQAEKQRLEFQRQQILAQTFNEAVAEKEKLIYIHRMSPNVTTKEDFFEALNELKPQMYIAPEFTAPAPDIKNTKFRLENEAKEKVQGSIFKIVKLRKKYVEDNLQVRYSKEVEDWENGRRDFIQWHQNKAAEENKHYQELYEEQCNYLNGLINGDSQIVEEAINEWLSSCEFPMKVNIDYELYLNDNLVFLDIDLPSIEELPENELIRLENGNLREKKKTQTTLKSEYKTLVLSLAVFISSHVFNTSPSIQNIVISGYTQRREKDGQYNDEYIYSILFSRNRFEKRNLSEVDPIDFSMSFENRINSTSTMILKSIKPFEFNDIFQLITRI